MNNLKQLKTGDKVKYKDSDKVYLIHHNDIKNKCMSLGLFKYPEIEQDFYTDYKNLECMI